MMLNKIIWNWIIKKVSCLYKKKKLLQAFIKMEVLNKLQSKYDKI